MNIIHTFSSALHALVQVRPAYAVAAILLYIVSFVIGGARWKKILAGLGCSSRLKDTSLGLLIGIWVNNITPLSRVGGEICRITLIRKWAKIDLKQAAVSVFYDRLATLAPILFLFILSFPILRLWVHNPGSLLLRVVLLITGLLLILVALFIAYRRLDSIRRWFSAQKARLVSIRIDRKKLAQAVGYSALVWAQDLLRLMIVAAAFNVFLNPHQAATLSLVALFCGFFPSVGGLGPTEGGLTAALHLFGIDLQTALAITVLERSISYVLGTCLGSIALAALGGRKLLRTKDPLTVPE